MRADDPDPFPLGAPVNRKPTAPPTPVPGRPGWFYDRRGGDPFYVEPGTPVPPPPERQTP